MAALVYHAGALGDFLTTLPAVSRFKAGRRLVLLGRPVHAALAPHLFEEAWDAGAAAFAPLFSRGDGVPGPLERRFRDVETALLFAWPDSPLPAALEALGVREILRQDPFPDSPLPVVDFHLSLFPGPISEQERIPRLALAPPPAEVRRGVALAFGSGSAAKNWPRERFEMLARWLAGRGEEVRWITGPVEEGESPGLPHQTWKDLPLPDLAARLCRCRLYVGNDSGVTHLAAAAGCRVVALFGPSDHRVWAPRGPEVTIIASASGRMSDITQEEVETTCGKLLGTK